MKLLEDEAQPDGINWIVDIIGTESVPATL